MNAATWVSDSSFKLSNIKRTVSFTHEHITMTPFIGHVGPGVPKNSPSRDLCSKQFSVVTQDHQKLPHWGLSLTTTAFFCKENTQISCEDPLADHSTNQRHDHEAVRDKRQSPI